MKYKGLLIALIISLGINLGAAGAITYHYIQKANRRHTWKKWEKKHDETWAQFQDTLGITPELTEEIRGIMKEGFEEKKKYWDDYRHIRDSILYELSQPELDTARLRELLIQDENLQVQSGMDMYSRLFETMSMLPPDKQDLYLAYYKSSIYFTGQPWYIAEYKEHKPKGLKEE